MRSETNENSEEHQQSLPESTPKTNKHPLENEQLIKQTNSSQEQTEIEIDLEKHNNDQDKEKQKECQEKKTRWESTEEKCSFLMLFCGFFCCFTWMFNLICCSKSSHQSTRIFVTLSKLFLTTLLLTICISFAMISIILVD